MSQSSRPNWEAKAVSNTGVYHVYDANGSGRAYSVRMELGRVTSVHNVTRGKTKRLDPSGPTAKMLVSVIRNQCGNGKRR